MVTFELPGEGANLGPHSRGELLEVRLPIVGEIHVHARDLSLPPVPPLQPVLQVIENVRCFGNLVQEEQIRRKLTIEAKPSQLLCHPLLVSLADDDVEI